MANLELTPEEAAALNESFPANPENPPVETPPETVETPVINPEEILGALQQISKQLEETKAPVPPKEEEKPAGWVPKDWNEVATRAAVEAKNVIEAKDKEKVDAERVAAENIEKLEKQVSASLAELEKTGEIPKMVDSKSDTDPGVMARKELFAFASQFNSLDFNLMLKNMKPMHDAGKYFDPKTFEWTDKSVNPGKNAPIGSSSKTTTPPKGGPDYKLIHGRSLDQLAALGMQE